MIKSAFLECLYLIAFLTTTALCARTQPVIRFIPPPVTGKEIRQAHGPHLALYDPAVASRHKLVVMIPGTGGSASDSRSLDSCFATMGFHVISLDYLNNVISTTCTASADSSCFDNFRQEIVFGSPVSSVVEVDSINSITGRLSKLLVYLAKNDPSGGWSAFLTGDQPAWEKIITAGHSQGAGHAAYLGKKFPLAGVLLFSGPQDYREPFHSPAVWQSRKGLTPPSRYYAFLHLKDPFHYSYQTANVAVLTERPATDTTMVFPGKPVKSDRHILVNDIETNNPHGSTVQTEFETVWRYMVEKL